MRWWPFGGRGTSPQAAAAESQTSDTATEPAVAERPRSADVPTTAEKPPAAREVVMSEPTVETVTEQEPVPGPVETDLDTSSLYLNRELSMLSFQERVLEEAEDHDNPLLERVKFLSIFSSNLAEFYMVRIAGLKQQVQAGVRDLSADGLTPAEQLAIVRESARQLIMRGRGLYSQLRDELAQNSIYVLGYDELDEHQRQDADRYFDDVVYPVLTPLAFDPGAPVPAYLEHEPEPRGAHQDTRGRGALRPGQDAQGAPSARPDLCRRRSGSVLRDQGR